MPRLRAVDPTGVRDRARQNRAIANDARILDAAVSVLADDGWEDASVLHISEVCGLARRTVLNRYGDRAGVAAAAWSARLAPRLSDALNAVIDAASPVEPHPQVLADALEPFIDADTHLRAAGEVLIVSGYQPDLRRVVAETLSEAVEPALSPTASPLSRADAARRAFVVSLALGALVEGRTFPDGIVMDVTADLGAIADALATRQPPTSLPSVEMAHLDETVVPDSDEAVARLLSAMLRLVGDHGYEATTIDRITREAGFSSGTLFGRYESKRSLFLDATARMLAQAEARNHAVLRELGSQYSPGIADAVMTREFMSVQRRRMRTITLEQYRLAWHDADVLSTFTSLHEAIVERLSATLLDLTDAQVRGRSFIGLARGIGMGLLANLLPSTSDLPYDVVSVPLMDDLV